MRSLDSEEVKSSLSNSSAFGSACDSAYIQCLSLNQHLDGVPPHELYTASHLIYGNLRSSPHLHPLILEWIRESPSLAQVERAFEKVSPGYRPGFWVESDLVRPALFKEWAVVLYADAVVGNTSKPSLRRVAVRVAGIAAAVGLIVYRILT